MNGSPVPQSPEDALTGGASIAVRPMTEADSDAVARLATQLGYPSTPDQVVRRYRSIGTSPESHVAVAVDGSGTVVGWIHVFGNRLLESEPDAEIGGLVVDEAVRGRGVGTALVAAAEAWARERGYPVVSVRSNVVRTATHEFYQERGYGIVKTQIKFRKTIAR
ncbi:MAG TPA: GNAT family N-acetyltransferase [Candidatus Eisenbacteria bacterium]|nr:GNAT family N-acetyltransferase [Candidatus Eisenbacteria bacterium]